MVFRQTSVRELYLAFGVKKFAPFVSVDACGNTKSETDVPVTNMTLRSVLLLLLGMRLMGGLLCWKTWDGKNSPQRKRRVVFTKSHGSKLNPRAKTHHVHLGNQGPRVLLKYRAMSSSEINTTARQKETTLHRWSLLVRGSWYPGHQKWTKHKVTL